MYIYILVKHIKLGLKDKKYDIIGKDNITGKFFLLLLFLKMKNLMLKLFI